MKKVIIRSLIILSFVIVAIHGILFLNSKFEFLPDEIMRKVDNFYYQLFNKENRVDQIDSADYVLLSTISNSSLFENMDLFVPKDTYIPSEEEINKTYKGLYSDSIVASRTNYDIIIQNYGIGITEEFKLSDFRNQIVSTLQKSHPDISFDTSHTINKDGAEIPTVEFSTEHEGRFTFSFIALVDVNGKFITVAVNSADPHINAYQFFYALISTMVIK